MKYSSFIIRRSSFKNVFNLQLFALSLLIICSCNSAQNHNKKVKIITLTDSYSRTVEIPQNAQRIISVSPGITEIICDLHCENRLIGRSDFCKYPPLIEQIPSVGGISNVNVEKITSLNPDLVLIGSMVPRQTVELLTKGGIPVFAIKEEQAFSGLYDSYRILGKILSKEKEVEIKIGQLKSDLQQVKKQNDSLNQNRPTVYYVVGYGETGDYTAAGNTHINDIIELSGCRNIAEDSKSWSFSRELLFSRNPDYIFVRTEDYESFCKTYPYSNLNAVKNKKVFPIESAFMDVLGPRSIEAIKYIASKIKTNS